MIKRVLAILLGLAVIAFWGFSVFDLWATLTNYQPYLADFPTEMIVWIQEFPLWRKLVWGLSTGLGVLGGVLVLFRLRAAGHVLAASTALMIGSFLLYDLPFANGMEMYGSEGVAMSAVLCVLAIVFTVAAYALARRRETA